MRNDPIVEEVRKIRDELAAKFNYDVEALGEYYRSQQTAKDRVIVKRPPKRATEETGPAASLRGASERPEAA